MDWNLKHDGIAEAEALRDHLDVRLRLALARFRGRVTRVVVYLQGGLEPPGSIDRSCRILAEVRGVGDVIARVVDSDWRSAAERAAQRIGHSVAREIDRSRRHPIPSGRLGDGLSRLPGEPSRSLPEA